MSAFLNEFLGAVDKALPRTPTITGWAATAAAIVDSRGGPQVICRAEESETLRDFRRQYNRALKTISAHTYIEAKAEWLKHGALLEANIQSETLHQHDGWTRTDWEQDFEQKMEAGKRDLRRIYRECLPTAQAVAKRFCDMAREVADSHEEAERRFHELYGVPYAGPSAVLVAIRKTIQIAEQRVELNEYGNASPDDMVPYASF